MGALQSMHARTRPLMSLLRQRTYAFAMPHWAREVLSARIPRYTPSGEPN